jgi:NADP-dependent 3-hydroxy acid dehydrogenase YdfG
MTSALFASARRRPEIESLVAQIKSEGLEATAIVADVNVEQDVIDLVSATVKTYGSPRHCVQQRWHRRRVHAFR